MKALRNSRGRQVSTWMALFVVVVMVAGAVAFQYAIDGSGDSRTAWDDSSPFDSARSMLDILGGFRQSVAANLWTKTDEVYHEYFGGSVWKEKAIFPYYWLITRLDPHFSMAYFFASWVLARFGNVDEGYALALEGLRYNPDSPQLQENLASIYFFFKKDPKKARYHLLKAIDLTGDEEQKKVYRTFLNTIDKVIAGAIQIPEVSSLQDLDKHNEGHHHEHEQ